MIPARGKILVRPVETTEVLDGGRIVLTETVREAWTLGQLEIVAVGAPTFCTDESCERQHHSDVLCVKAGAIPEEPIYPGKVWIVDEPCSLTIDRVHLIDERLVPGAWILAKPRTTIDSGERDLFFIGVDDVIALMSDD